MLCTSKFFTFVICIGLLTGCEFLSGSRRSNECDKDLDPKHCKYSSISVHYTNPTIHLLDFVTKASSQYFVNKAVCMLKKKKTKIEFSGRKETATWAEICWTELPRGIRGLSSAGHHQKFLLLSLTN
jgi:hypothetical protein